MTKQPAIIIDLDGTLANCEHRRHHLEKSPKDWASFYAEMHYDQPQDWCRRLIAAMEQYAEILIVSGRPSSYRATTISWLLSHNIIWTDLLMRAEGDFRADNIVKEELYRERIAPIYDVLFAVDDRQQVVDMWRSLGITTLQCAPGNF